MTDPVTFDTVTFTGEGLELKGYIEQGPLLFTDQTFTRSDGTIFSRIYERLTKMSRRRATTLNGRTARKEQAYREGVKDTLEALRTELS